MNHEFFEQVIWGNTIRQYIIIASILLIGLFFKRIISRGLSKLFFRVFKKFAEQVNPETFISLLIRPVEFFLSVFTLFIAIKQLKHPLNVTFFNYKKTVGAAKINEVFTIGELVDKVFLFLILLSIFWIVLRVIDFIAHVLLVRAAKTKNRADDQLVPFIKELLKFLISFIGFFVLLGYVFEVNAVSLITGLGIGGIAIAMAAKESLENLLGSFLIFLDNTCGAEVTLLVMFIIISASLFTKCLIAFLQAFSSISFNGHAGVVSTTENLIVNPSISRSSIIPRVTKSFFKSGSSTFLNASSIFSFVNSIYLRLYSKLQKED